MCVVRVRTVRLAGAAAGLLWMTACASRAPTPPPVTPGPAPPPVVETEPEPTAVRTGLASFYGRAFEGRRTASGVPFDKDALVAAHPTLPFGTRVRVTSLDNGRSVIVRIVDRGPSNENRAEGVIIDLSRAAAAALGFLRDGRQRVRLEVLAWGERPRTLVELLTGLVG